jgi:hypothetical protein
MVNSLEKDKDSSAPSAAAGEKEDGRLSQIELVHRQLVILMAQYILSGKMYPEVKERFKVKFREVYGRGYIGVCQAVNEHLIDERAAGFNDGSVSIEDFCDDALMFVNLGFKALPTRYMQRAFEDVHQNPHNKSPAEVKKDAQYIIDAAAKAGLVELAEYLNRRKATLMKYAQDNNLPQDSGGP